MGLLLLTVYILGLHKITPVSMLVDKDDMQSLEGREREKEKKKKGMHSMYAYNDSCSVTLNKVYRDSESMPGSRCLSYDGESSVTFRSNITYAILFFSSAIFSNY